MDMKNNEMQSVLNVLVKQVMNKYGVDPSSIQIPEEQKQEIRNMVSGLQKEVAKLEQQNNTTTESETTEENSNDDNQRSRGRRNRPRLGRLSDN